MQEEQFDVHIKEEGIIWIPNLREIWHSRDMLFFLVLRDFKIRFKQSFLGIAWVLLQPVLSTLVFSAIIGKALNVSFDAPYPIAFLSALMGWNYFSKVMTNGILTVVNEAEMIRKVYFPRIILPLYQAISYLIDLSLALIIFFALCFYYDYSLSINILLLPLYTLQALMLSVGMSLWLGPINVRFRDIQIIIPLLLQILFILTPVMYPTPESLSANNENILAFLYNLNPITCIIDGFRFALLGQGTPLALPFIISHCFIFFLFLSGFAFFNSSQKKFADII